MDDQLLQDQIVGSDSGEMEDLPRQDTKDMESSEQEDESNSDFESNGGEWTGLTSVEVGKQLAELLCQTDEDPNDMDWIPY